jgi:hypothetical protein
VKGEFTTKLFCGVYWNLHILLDPELYGHLEHLAMSHEIDINLGSNKEATMSDKTVMVAALLHSRSMSSVKDILGVPINYAGG